MLRPILYLVSLYAWWCVCAHYFQLSEPLPSTPYEVARVRMAKQQLEHSAQAQASELAVEAPTPAAVAERTGTVGDGDHAHATPVSTSATTGGGGSATSASTKGSATSAAVVAAATTAKQCPPGRRPYHTLLTAQGSIYNQWQARIMYHHWQKQKAKDGPCTEMSGFTRLCPSPNGEPDGVEKFIPTVRLRACHAPTRHASPLLRTPPLTRHSHAAPRASPRAGAPLAYRSSSSS